MKILNVKEGIDDSKRVKKKGKFARENSESE
jgi:hypothetical protein